MSRWFQCGIESSLIQCKMSRNAIPLLTLVLIFCIPANAESSNSNGILACYGEPCLHGLCIDHTNRYPPSSGIRASRYFIAFYTKLFDTRSPMLAAHHTPPIPHYQSVQTYQPTRFYRALRLFLVLWLTLRVHYRWIVEILARSMQW